MSTLLESVRAAAGPDRYLSRDIWQMLNTPEWKSAYMRAQEPCGCPHDQAVEYAVRYLPDVTNSIDDALSLATDMLPDCRFALYTNGPACLVMRGDEPVLADEHAATLPLAIVAAALVAVGNNEPPER